MLLWRLLAIFILIPVVLITLSLAVTGLVARAAILYLAFPILLLAWVAWRYLGAGRAS